MEEKYHICWSRQKPTSKTLRQQDIQGKWKEAAGTGLVERTSLSGSWVGILAQQHPQKPHASVFLQSGGTPNILDGTNATSWPRNITRSEPIRKTVPIHKSIIARQSILRIPYFPLILHFFKISWKELGHLREYSRASWLRRQSGGLRWSVHCSSGPHVKLSITGWMKNKVLCVGCSVKIFEWPIRLEKH